MMKKEISYRTVGIGMLVLTLLAALFRSLAFAISFDHEVGYFDPGVFPTLLYIVIALALIGVALYAWLARRSSAQHGFHPVRTERSSIVTVCSWLIALTYAAVAALDLFAFTSGNASTLILVRAIAAALAIPYFLFPSSKRVLAFGLASHVHCLLVLVGEYIDRYVAMNSPLKLMQQFALIAFMLYLVMELYAAIGTPRPIRTAVFGLVAAFLCISNGTSCIVAGIVGSIIPRDYLMGAIVSLALGLYTAARLYTAAKRPNANETEDI